MGSSRHEGGWDPSYRNFEDDDEDNGAYYSGPIKPTLGLFIATAFLGTVVGFGVGGFSAIIKERTFEPKTQIANQYRGRGALAGAVGLPLIIAAGFGMSAYRERNKNKKIEEV